MREQGRTPRGGAPSGGGGGSSSGTSDDSNETSMSINDLKCPLCLSTPLHFQRLYLDAAPAAQHDGSVRKKDMEKMSTNLVVRRQQEDENEQTAPTVVERGIDEKEAKRQEVTTINDDNQQINRLAPYPPDFLDSTSGDTSVRGSKRSLSETQQEIGQYHHNMHVMFLPAPLAPGVQSPLEDQSNYSQLLNLRRIAVIQHQTMIMQQQINIIQRKSFELYAQKVKRSRLDPFISQDRDDEMELEDEDL